MENKNILITGCSSGIGKETAFFLRKNGWQVFLTARKQDDVKVLIDSGFNACRLDLEDSSSIKEAVEFVLSKTKNRLYALVNNAGYGLTSAVEDLKRDEILKQFEVNVFGLQELTNLIIPIFRKQGYGRIINVSSIVGKLALPYMGAYCASKFALEALSDALRWELSNTSIYVSIIEPGPIKTNFSINASKTFDSINKSSNFHHKAYSIIEKGRRDKTRQSRKYPAIAVAKKILHALESKRPRARYPVTSQAFFAILAKKIVPDSIIDFFIKKYLKRRGYI